MPWGGGGYGFRIDINRYSPGRCKKKVEKVLEEYVLAFVERRKRNHSHGG
jgi:hypothetical protein